MFVYGWSVLGFKSGFHETVLNYPVTAVSRTHTGGSFILNRNCSGIWDDRRNDVPDARKVELSSTFPGFTALQA